MMRPQFPSHSHQPASHPGGSTTSSGPNQQFFDSSAANQSQHAGYPQIGNTAAGQQPLLGSNKVPGGNAGVQSGAAPAGSSLPVQPAPLVFTPSGSSGSAAPAFKNIRTTLTALTEQYENAIANRFKADAAFIQNYVAGVEKLNRGSDGMDLDEKPVIEPEVKPDAEIMALIQELSAVDTFRQTANQAYWTARHLPHTTSSHFDPNFELPSNLDNPTLTELQQLAQDQINFVKRYRKAFSDCVSVLEKEVEPLTEDDYVDFLKSDAYRNSQN